MLSFVPDHFISRSFYRPWDVRTLLVSTPFMYSWPVLTNARRASAIFPQWRENHIERAKIQIQDFSRCEVTALNTESLCHCDLSAKPTEWSKPGTLCLPTVSWKHPNTTEHAANVPPFKHDPIAFLELNTVSLSQSYQTQRGSYHERNVFSVE